MPDKVFFTSYARLDNDDEALSEVVKLLLGRVKKKFGEEVETLFDTEDMTNGAEWEQRLADALRELRVMVCMCSPGYLKSAFCAKEFAVFRQRLAAIGPNAVGILPLIWEPTALPQTIGRLAQTHDARFPADYALVGLWKYWQLKAQRDNFIQIIDAIAGDIHKAHTDSQLQRWPQDVKFDDLPDSFDDPHAEPYGATLTVLDEKRSRWKPGKADATIGGIFDDVARVLRVCWRDVPIDTTTLVDDLKETAKARQAAIFVIEHAKVANPPWVQLLAELDGSQQTNFAVLIARKKEEIPAATDAKQELQALLPASTAAGAPHAFFPLDDVQACNAALNAAITTLQLALVKEDQAAQVVGNDLRDQARSNGIDVDRPAPLAGPGAQQ
jgi:hypothetical protein